MLFPGGSQDAQSTLPEDVLAADIDRVYVDGTDQLIQILANYADSQNLESNIQYISDDIQINDFVDTRDRVQKYVNMPNMREQVDAARSSFVARVTLVANAHKEAILLRRLEAFHRSPTSNGPCLPGIESKNGAAPVTSSPAVSNGEGIIKQRAEQYLKEQVDEVIRKYDRFASDQTAQVKTQAAKVRELYDRRLGEIRLTRKTEFRAYEKAQQRSAWSRKCDSYIRSVGAKLENSSPLQRTLLLYYIAAWRVISDLEKFRRVLMWTTLVVLVAIFVSVGYLAWTNEFVREYIDSDERVTEQRIGSRIVLNLREKPVKPIYTNHYLWMMHQTQPAKQFSPFELRDGFFEASWSRGRSYNVSVQTLESWMRKTAEHEKSTCVCAQHLGIDRYAVYTSNRLLCDPIVLAETGERRAVRAVGDWLLDDYVKHGILAEHPTYEVPLGVRIQYLAPHGTYAGLETSMQLIQDSVACVHLCGTLSRNPVQNKD